MQFLKKSSKYIYTKKMTKKLVTKSLHFLKKYLREVNKVKRILLRKSKLDSVVNSANKSLKQSLSKSYKYFKKNPFW